MAKYDVYRSGMSPGYLLDIQSDLLDGLNTRAVVPLMPIKDAPKPAERLNPVFKIKLKKHIMVTQLMSSVPVAVFEPPITNIAECHAEITSAIDMLMRGF